MVRTLTDQGRACQASGQGLDRDGHDCDQNLDRDGRDMDQDQDLDYQYPDQDQARNGIRC